MTPTHTQGRLYVGDPRDDVMPVPGVIEIAAENSAYLVGYTLLTEDAAELVRRWNAFEEGGAVALAIEALRAVEAGEDDWCQRCALFDPKGERKHKDFCEVGAALAALTEEAGT